MSNRDPDTRYERPEQAIPWMIEQHCRQSLHTALPGLIEAYDPRTKRARVQPALRRLLAPSPLDNRTRADRALILDVPVCHPSGGGFVIHIPLRSGDPVLLVFSERGLDHFKATFEVADPTVSGFFDVRDAVAIPGFGALNITPASTDGLSLQTEDGATSIVMTPGQIELRAERIVNRATRIDDMDY